MRTSRLAIAARAVALAAALPEGVTLQDYHAADAHGKSLPEEYVTRITLAKKVGVEELARHTNALLPGSCQPYRDLVQRRGRSLERTELHKHR